MTGVEGLEPLQYDGGGAMTFALSKTPRGTEHISEQITEAAAISLDPAEFPEFKYDPELDGPEE